MSDKNWMLNPTAIAHARVCITIIQAELGVKLKLSHPQFLEMIKDYIELTDSAELANAYNALVAMAGSELGSVTTEPQKVVSLKPQTSAPASAAAASNNEDMVEFKGRLYPKYSEDGEFKGLYRGQPRYA